MMSKRILIIEDDESIRELLTEFLGHEDYEVLSAENGAVALTLLAGQEQLPDMVLLDIMMPVMDGLRFYHESRNDPRLHNLNLIMMSANPSMISKHVRKDVYHFLVKPVDLNKLLSLLHEVERLSEVEVAS
jgi:CheY-like chemotaxis protein